MKRFFFILIILTSLSANISAENSGNLLLLSVEDAVTLGLQNNYNLKVKTIETAQKSREQRDAWNVLIPDISASATLSRSNVAASGSGVAVLGTNNPFDSSSFSADDGLYDYIFMQGYEYEADPWTLVGKISAQLALSPAMVNGAKQLDLDYRNSMLEYNSAELSTRQSIKRNFYNLLLLQEQISVLEKNIQTTENRLESMQLMYSYGYITELDLLNTRSGLSSMGPSLSKMEDAYQQLLMAFKMDLGLDLSIPLELSGTVEVVPENLYADKLIQSFLTGRIDLQQLSVNYEMLENSKSAVFNQSYLPALVLGYSYSPYISDPFASESWDNEDMYGDNGAFSVTLSIPVDEWLPHSASANKIKASEDALNQLEYQKELAYTAAEMEIRSLVRTLNTSRKNMEVLTESIELNQKNYDMSREAYEKGELQLLELESSENSLLQAELDLLSEKYSYISNFLSLEQALNTEL